MKRQQIIIYNAIVLFLFTNIGFGVIAFEDGKSHLINYQIIDSLYVYNGPLSSQTTVNLFKGGSVIGLSPWAGNIEIHDNSLINIDGGSIQNYLTCNDMSQAIIKSGSAGTHLYAKNYSSVNLSGGSVGIYHADQSSSLNMKGGTIGKLYANDDCRIDVSGGTLNELAASTNAEVTFYGYDFQTTGGLILSNGTISGTGILRGTWWGGGNFTVNISQNFTTASIRAIPEPASLLFLALGGALIRKR